ncbi:DUF4105 domain-containing protein [Flavobacteriales bacterium]|nr:DUF4105 domain-containing protein [Flavobacteriales bacterium]
MTYKILFLLIITPVYLIGNNIDFTKNINTTKISILTCDPGNEIYSLFGHSALRIKDTKNQIDIVVNWGLFEFSENQFEFGYDFAKGRLNYFMGLQSMSNFINEYARSNRGVREQVLNLDEQEKLNLLSIISENYKPENRNYQYEFFYDNCSSRIRDLLIEVFKEKINFHKSPLADKNTFRETIHQYLKYDPWLELGIDLVLGKKIDILVSNNNLMFLPEKVESILDKSQVENESVKKNIILTKSTIVNSNNQERTSENIIKYSWGIFFITLILLYLKQSHLIRIWSIMNLSVLGIIGILLIFMWWGTDHQATKMNFNLLWASPLHFILIVNILKKKSGVFYYWFLVFSLIIIFSTVLFWFALIQDFNPFVKPLILQLGLIYYYYFKKNKNQINLHKTSG